MIAQTVKIALIGMGLMSGTVAQAVQLADGTVSFSHSPRLLSARTTFKRVRIPGAKYYFTLSIPEQETESLYKVIINQRQGSDAIRFLVEETFAFEGTFNNRGKILVTETFSDSGSNTPLFVTFPQSVSPGTTITIGLKPRKNPRWSGVYLFGITAFPTGEKSRGLYLGVGRLHFFSGGIRR